MQDQPLDRDALHAILDFHVEAGVDIALDETPHNRFAETPAPIPVTRTTAPNPAIAPKSGAPAPRALPPLAALAPEEAALQARELARDAPTLEALETVFREFEGCALKFSAKNFVFADGNPQSRIMMVGDAPGSDDDRLGRPLTGPPGEMLDRMLAAIGLDRTGVYLANVVPWRPPGNRAPTPQEVATCLPFIERQIELASPDFLICLGGPPTQILLDTKEGILRARGRWTIYKTDGGREIRALSTLHPTYLLRQPLQKRLGWRDFQTLRRALDGQE